MVHKWTEHFCDEINEFVNQSVYLFFWNFKGFQVVTDNTKFFFKFNDFAAEIETKRRKKINKMDLASFDDQNTTTNGMLFFFLVKQKSD